MKGKSWIICLLFVCTLIGRAEPNLATVSKVTARQRYPWNGLVDIVVTFSGSSNNVALTDCEFAATNVATKVALPVVSVSREGSVSGSGTTWIRRYVWDAAADVGLVKIEDVAFTVEEKTFGVQLWENGPYWAECNVGATKPEEYGYYFWWGDTTGYKRVGRSSWNAVDGSRTGFSFGSDDCPTFRKEVATLQLEGWIDASGNLVAAHDAATAYLGAPWRMPTDAEFDALTSNCDTTWVTQGCEVGRLVKGRGAYSSRSIFLPATTSASGLGVLYWSASAISYGCTPSLYVFRGSLDTYDDGARYDWHFVRPVRGFAK